MLNAEKMEVDFNASLEDGTACDSNSREGRKNSSLQNSRRTKSALRFTIGSYDSKIPITSGDVETLHDKFKTSYVGQNVDNRNFTSGMYQRNSIVLQNSTKASSLAEDDTDVGVDDNQSFLSQSSTREQNKEIVCSAVTNSLEGNNSQSNQHELGRNSNNSALCDEVCDDHKIKQDWNLFDESFVNRDSISEQESHVKKYADINKDSEKTSDRIPDFIQTIIDGRRICGDSYVEFSKPSWFDEEKYKRGQRFARDHLFSIVFADLLSLMILFAIKSGLKTLIFTGQSNTPYKAFRRYLSTTVRVNSWYNGDIWDVNSEAHKNLKTVRAMHEATRKRIEACSKEEFDKKVTFEEDGGNQQLWTDLHEDIQNDFQNSCPFHSPKLSDPNEVHISQGGMAGTQFGFFGLILVYPKMFGIHNASNADLEGFIHFWRTIAYLLGTEDRFNLCNGDLTTVRQRCVDMIAFVVKVEFCNVSREWVHMSRVMVQGIKFYIFGISFEVALLYLCKILNIKAAKLTKSLTLFQWFIYLCIHVVFGFLLRFASMHALFNRLVKRAIKRALNFSPEHLQKLKERAYPYETSSDAQGPDETVRTSSSSQTHGVTGDRIYPLSNPH